MRRPPRHNRRRRGFTAAAIRQLRAAKRREPTRDGRCAALADDANQLLLEIACGLEVPRTVRIQPALPARASRVAL